MPRPLSCVGRGYARRGKADERLVWAFGYADSARGVCRGRACDALPSTLVAVGLDAVLVLVVCVDPGLVGGEPGAVDGVAKIAGGLVSVLDAEVAGRWPSVDDAGALGATDRGDGSPRVVPTWVAGVVCRLIGVVGRWAVVRASLVFGPASGLTYLLVAELFVCCDAVRAFVARVN